MIRTKPWNICKLTVSVLLLTGCLNTEGDLEIAGNVVDEYTKELIGGRDIIIHGILRKENDYETIYAGQFSTDSVGSFSYLLQKIPDSHYYNFFIAGDSEYVSTQKMLGLLEIRQNAKHLIFTMNRLAELTIIIKRESRNKVRDTLSLYWKSNGIYGKNIYPWEINNYANPGNYAGLTKGTELRWVGRNVNSTVTTRVFADKRTELLWSLDRNGKREEINDTITCRRDAVNIFHFTY